MLKYLALILVAIASQVSLADVDRGDIRLPTYIFLERQIAQDIKDMNDPDEVEEYVDVVRWVHKTRVALFHLVEGNIQRFYDAALTLPESAHDISDPYYAVLIAELLHYAVEADIEIADAKLIELFREANRGFANNSVISPELRVMFQASYYYSVADLAQLSALTEESNRLVSKDGYFVCGYTNLLFAKLTSSAEKLDDSIACLNQISDSVDQVELFGEHPVLGTALRNTVALGYHRLAVGRASLLRATALRLLAETQRNFVDRRQYINDAARAATLARRNIDPIDSPIMWGTAYKVTSEVLEVLHSIESLESSGEAINDIVRRRDRAYQISVLYR